MKAKLKLSPILDRFLYRAERRKAWKTPGPFFLSIRIKIALFFITLITIAFLIVGIFTYLRYKTDTERNTAAYSTQIVTQIRLNLDRYIKEIERLTLSPLYDQRVIQILMAHQNPANLGGFIPSDEQLKMNLFVSSLIFDRAEVEGIVFFTNDGGLFSNSDKTTQTQWLPSENEWMKVVEKEDGGLTILPPHTAYYYYAGKEDVVSLARLIKEPYTNRKLGYIKVDLNDKGLERILTPVNLGKDSHLFVTDKLNRILYPFYSTSLPDTTDSGLLTITQQSEYSGLQITGQIPLEELHKDAVELSNFTLLVALFSLAGAYILAIVISDRITGPLLHLRSKMRLVQDGSLHIRAKVTSHDEIGQVTVSFNKMVGEIERLVREVYEVNIREREAEMAALISQMNPHFLYNTLESINMIAIQSGNMTLSGSVSSLGKLLRYTVDNRQKIVFVREEVRFAEAYFQIQAMRLGSRLNSHIEVEPGLDHAFVPKLIIQPLVENAIEHGLGQEPLTVDICIFNDNGRLKIRVEDDGEGMTEARIAQVSAALECKEVRSSLELQAQETFGEKRKGFALRNSHQRVQLLYGERFGIELAKREPRGMNFTISLPLQWRNEEDESDAG